MAEEFLVGGAIWPLPVRNRANSGFYVLGMRYKKNAKSPRSKFTIRRPSYAASLCVNLITEVFSLLFLGHALPYSSVLSVPRIATTAKGDGLIMTYEKSIYSFKCVSSDSCFFQKDGDLKINRTWHILLTVPASLVEDC